MSFSIPKNLPPFSSQPLEMSIEVQKPCSLAEEPVADIPSSQYKPLVLSENLPSALHVLRKKWDKAVAEGDKEPFREIENNFSTIEKGLQDQPLLALEYMGPIFLARLQSNGGDLYFTMTQEADSPQKKCALRWQKALRDYLFQCSPDTDITWMQIVRLCFYNLKSNASFSERMIELLSGFKRTEAVVHSARSKGAEILNSNTPADLKTLYKIYVRFQRFVVHMPTEEVRDFHQIIRQLLQKYPSYATKEGLNSLNAILDHAPWLDSTSSLFTAEDFNVFLAVEKEASLDLKLRLLKYVVNALRKCSKNVDKAGERGLHAEKIFAYLFSKTEPTELISKMASEKFIEDWNGALVFAFSYLVHVCPNIERLMAVPQKKASLSSQRKEVDPSQKKFIDYLLQPSHNRCVTSTKWFTLFSLRSKSAHTQALLRETCLNILKTSPYQDREKGDDAAEINLDTALRLQDIFIDCPTSNRQKKAIKDIRYYSFNFDFLSTPNDCFVGRSMARDGVEAYLKEILGIGDFTCRPLLKEVAYSYLFHLFFGGEKNLPEWTKQVGLLLSQVKQLNVPEFDDIFKVMDAKRKGLELMGFPHSLYMSRCPKLAYFVIKNDIQDELPSYIDASHPLINHNLNKAFMDKVLSSLEAEDNKVWDAFLKILEGFADNKIIKNYFLEICAGLFERLKNDFFDFEPLDIRFRLCKLCCHFGFSQIYCKNPSTIEEFIVRCMVNFNSPNKIQEAGLVDWLDISLKNGLFASEKTLRNLTGQGVFAVLYGTLEKSKGNDQNKAPTKRDVKTLNLMKSLCPPSQFSYLMSLPEGGEQFIQVQSQIEMISTALAQEVFLYQQKCQNLDEKLEEKGTHTKQECKVLVEKFEKDLRVVQEMHQAFTVNFNSAKPPSVKKLNAGYQALLKARDASLKKNEEQYDQQIAEIEKALQREAECRQKVENATKILAAEFDKLKGSIQNNVISLQEAEKQTELSKWECIERLKALWSKEENRAEALKRIEDSTEDIQNEANLAIAQIRSGIFSPHKDVQLYDLQEELKQKKIELEQTKKSLDEKISAITAKDRKIEKQKKRLERINSEKNIPLSVGVAFPVMPATLKGKIEEFAHKKISRQFFLYSQKPTSKHALKTLLEVCGFQFAGTEGSHEHYKWYLSDRSVFSAVTLSDHGDELQPATSKDALKAIGKVITHQLEMKRYEQILLKRSRPSVPK